MNIHIYLSLQKFTCDFIHISDPQGRRPVRLSEAKEADLFQQSLICLRPKVWSGAVGPDQDHTFGRTPMRMHVQRPKASAKHMHRHMPDRRYGQAAKQPTKTIPSGELKREEKIGLCKPKGRSRPEGLHNT